jgi:hypothetical protein
MSTGNATVTSTYGPGRSAVATVISDVKSCNFDIERDVLRLTTGTNHVVQDFSYDALATITYTVSGGVATITVST